MKYQVGAQYAFAVYVEVAGPLTLLLGTRRDRGACAVQFYFFLPAKEKAQSQQKAFSNIIWTEILKIRDLKTSIRYVGFF